MEKTILICRKGICDVEVEESRRNKVNKVAEIVISLLFSCFHCVKAKLTCSGNAEFGWIVNCCQYVECESWDRYSKCRKQRYFFFFCFSFLFFPPKFPSSALSSSAYRQTTQPSYSCWPTSGGRWCMQWCHWVSHSHPQGAFSSLSLSRVPIKWNNESNNVRSVWWI